MSETNSEPVDLSEFVSETADESFESGKDICSKTSAEREDKSVDKNEGESVDKEMSKRQIRKMRLFEKHREQKRAKRLQEKQKQKEKNKTMFLETGLSSKMKREFLKSALDRSIDVNIVFDLSFANLMSEKDQGKVAKQVHRCYSVNRASDKPLRLHLTGMDDKTRTSFRRCNPGFEFWQTSSQTDLPYHEFFKMQGDLQKLFYLTAESDNCMQELSVGNYYVIGGLVDHNSLKGHCHKLANENAVSTIRLPISEHIDLKTRHVLTINHVFEILLAVAQGKTWKEALLHVIPQRTGVTVKNDSSSSNPIGITCVDDSLGPVNSQDSQVEDDDDAKDDKLKADVETESNCFER